MRRSTVTASTTAILAAVLAAGPSVAATPTTTATIPITVAGPSLRTASATSAPAGRAVAIIGYSELPTVGDLVSQSVLVGADRNTYRTLDGGGLLSPDGMFAARPGTDGTLRLLNLTTGAERAFTLNDDGQTRPLAFSPDGMFLVCGHSRDPEGTWVDPVVLLDVRTGAKTALIHRTAPTAAFSPDGQRIAVRVDGANLILDRTGRELQRIPTSAGILANENAWSPDGRWLAVTTDSGLSFAPVGPTSDDKPADRHGTDAFLGWHSDTEIAVLDYGTDAAQISIHDIRSGTSRVLTTTADGYASPLPAGLLLGLTSRPPADPDRGPWPMWIWFLALGAVAIIATPIAFLIRLRRTRTSSHV